MRYRPLPMDPLPRELADAEGELVAQRRRAADIPSDRPRIGLALSGGGIRSATFSLGVLQGLARMKLLACVDYLSTVSGGGYAGSFLGGLFCPRGAAPPTPAQVEAELGDPRHSGGPVARSVAWLRENGRYLTPGGSGDSLLAAGTILRNWVAVQVVLGLLLLEIFMALDGLLGALGWNGVLAPLALGRGPLLLPSPWFVPALGLLCAGGLLLGWAYWLVDRKGVDGRRGMIQHPRLVLVLFLLGLLALLLRGAAFPGLDPRLLRIGLALLAGVGALALAVSKAFSSPGDAEARRSLTRALRMALLASLALALAAVVDSAGWTLWHAWFRQSAPAAGVGGWQGALHWIDRALRALFSANGIPLLLLSAAVAFHERLAKLLGPQSADRFWEAGLRALGKALFALLAASIALLWLGAFSALAHRLSFGPVPAGPVVAVRFVPHGEWFAVLGGLAILNGLLGRVIGFLNLSTLGPFYTAALTRAYVGASSHERREGDVSPERRDADDIPWEHYQPWRSGGPLHLINVTLNETTGGRSQVVQKDRKGLGLAVGPAGISLGTQHHALRVTEDASKPPATVSQGFQAFAGSLGPEPPLFEPESLTLGQWVGVSGAAFTTGLGSRTSLPASLLLGFLNVRLGYWWWTGLAPSRRCITKEGKRAAAVGAWDRLRLFCEALVPVHAHLLGEWFARFPGSASRHWYLSDGGHSENTGILELVRRRLPLIIACDNGQDPGRALGDLARLVAKARVDLGVEVAFLDPAGLDRVLGPDRSRAFGTLEELVDHGAPALAALAELHYGGQESPGLLFVLKPTLGPDLPLDLRAYAKANPGFPQQSTMDQFFDEAQWEAYRALGEVTVQATLGAHRRLFIP